MIFLIMGVTGSGKSTVGRMLANCLGWVYLEADDFHSTANKEKMHRGEPLTEADRLNQRKQHFAGVAILNDQFATLEEPQNALTIDIKERPEEIVETILGKVL